MSRVFVAGRVCPTEQWAFRTTGVLADDDRHLHLLWITFHFWKLFDCLFSFYLPLVCVCVCVFCPSLLSGDTWEKTNTRPLVSLQRITDASLAVSPTPHSKWCLKWDCFAKLLFSPRSENNLQASFISRHWKSWKSCGWNPNGYRALVSTDPSPWQLCKLHPPRESVWYGGKLQKESAIKWTFVLELFAVGVVMTSGALRTANRAFLC